MAKDFMDATYIPPIFRPNVLLLLCNSNNISLCICRETIYHRALYLINKIILYRNNNLRKIKLFIRVLFSHRIYIHFAY